MRLTRRLYSKGYEREDIVRFYRFLDWVLRLPKELETELRRQVRILEGNKTMPYVSTIERMGREEGFCAGLLEAIKFGLKLRFGQEGLALIPSVEALTDPDVLRAFHEAVFTTATQ